jgi:hypothetical protein
MMPVTSQIRIDWAGLAWSAWVVSGSEKGEFDLEVQEPRSKRKKDNANCIFGT